MSSRKEGAQLWFDMMAMPADAPDPDNAYAFMNFILAARDDGQDLELRHLPERGAGLAAADQRRREGRPSLFPPEELRSKLFVVTPYDQKVQRVVTRLWTKIVTGS